jgi:hypothetical protein
MADNSTNSAGLQADSEATIPRIRLGEAGFSGLRVTNKQILEEANRVFQYPQFLKTVSEMRNNPTVAAAFNVYRMLISRVKWTVEPPEKATDEQKTRAKHVQQCMDDMEGSWESFISDTLTYLEYGFSVQEKVYRRRLKKNGSKYNDGLVGLRKLAPRGQDTISKWYFSEDGRDLVALGQATVNLENAHRYQNITGKNEDGVVEIPRDKVLLFTADATKGNPQGRSLLKPIYLAYKRLELLQDQELLGIAKDLAGIPLIQIPPKYMDANASPEDKAVYEMCKKIVDNLANGEQRGLVFPKMADPDSKLDLFSVSLLERKGQGLALDPVIQRYQNDLLMALACDVLRLGATDGGSFSLADSKTNMLTLALSHRLKEIASVLNTELIPQLYALNGWTDEELPKFEAGDIEEVSMEEFSKLIQRVASVGLVEVDREWLNKIREVAGIEPRPADEPVDKESLSGATSKSGDGMEVGRSGNGTAKIGGKGNKKDSSAGNSENAA